MCHPCTLASSTCCVCALERACDVERNISPQRRVLHDKRTQPFLQQLCTLPTFLSFSGKHSVKSSTHPRQCLTNYTTKFRKPLALYRNISYYTNCLLTFELKHKNNEFATSEHLSFKSTSFIPFELFWKKTSLIKIRTHLDACSINSLHIFIFFVFSPTYLGLESRPSSGNYETFRCIQWLWQLTMLKHYF